MSRSFLPSLRGTSWKSTAWHGGKAIPPGIPRQVHPSLPVPAYDCIMMQTLRPQGLEDCVSFHCLLFSKAQKLSVFGLLQFPGILVALM